MPPGELKFTVAKTCRIPYNSSIQTNNKGKQMKKVTKTHASVLVNQLVEHVRITAETKYNCKTDSDQVHFALGYIMSVLTQVAGSSPKAFAQLQETLNYTIQE
jgi:hypothetical protein